MPINPRIGEPRICKGNIGVLYPGEVARAYITPELIEAALIAGKTEIAIEEYFIEPAPGWRARWLRFQYRVFGRFFLKNRTAKIVEGELREVQ